MDEAIEAWPALEAGSYGAVERFVVFFEQLAIACELLESNTLAKARAALVGVDNLAHLVLNAHARAVFRSEEGGSHGGPRRRHTAAQRKKTLGDFSKMVELALKETDGPSWKRVPAILSGTDAAVMRVAHSYRNGVYHEDLHNAALLPALVALYAASVGRSRGRGYHHSESWGITPDQAARLAAIGYAPEPDSLTPRTLMLDFGAAAQLITTTLTANIQVDESALRTWLAADIVERASHAAETVVALVDDGMPIDRLLHVFRWSQFWAAHRADPEMLAHLAERERLQDSENERAAYEAAVKAHTERIRKLQSEFDYKVEIDAAKSLLPRGERLLQARDLGGLLQNYQRIDADLRDYERLTTDAVTAWNSLLQAADDRARGRLRD